MTEKEEIKKQQEQLKELHKNMLLQEEEHRKGQHIPPTDSYIIMRNINKVYDNHIQAVFDFNLDIKKHELVVFVGPSGCGKSTTLRMIAGLEEITTGDLFIDGVYCNEKTAKERDVAMVFQNYALYPHMTVYENMAFGLEIRKYSKDQIDERVKKAAKILQIDDYLYRLPKELSGGQRQRVALGRAIVREAKVFLMDEPLSNLDAKLRVSMRSEIIKLHKKINATTIYVTHDQTEAMTMANKIVVMKDGFIQQIGTPEDIYNHPSNTFVATFIGTPAMNLIKCKYDNGLITINDELKIELSPEQIRLHDNFFHQQIEAVNKLIDDKEYEKPDLNVLLTMHKNKPTLKNLFKKKETIIITTPEERLEQYKCQIKHYEDCLKGEHELIFGIRPEDIYEDDEIPSNVKKSSSLIKNIAVLELLGSEYYIHMNQDDQEIIAKCKASRHLDDTIPFKFIFDLNKYHIFDSLSKKAIY